MLSLSAYRQVREPFASGMVKCYPTIDHRVMEDAENRPNGQYNYHPTIYLRFLRDLPETISQGDILQILLSDLRE